MSDASRAILEQVRRLTPREQVEVADAVLELVDGQSDGLLAEDDPALDAEISRRLDEVEAGRVKTVPWEQVSDLLQRDIDAAR
jgi:putative addiction module component (TIGR02574 family)